MKEEVFYAGIKDPLDLRRGMLETSKDIIKSLQRNEKLKAIREEKIEQIMKLNQVMGDIGKLNAQLKAELPKTELRAREEKEPSGKNKKTIRLPRKEPETMSEIERLEKELDFIDSKLSKLS